MKVPSIVLAILAAAILGISAGLLAYASRSGDSDRFPLDAACYSIIDRNGVEHKSWFPPVAAADGGSIFTFNNDHKWGYVFGPSAMIADRDCLRERGVDVPPLDGTDE